MVKIFVLPVVLMLVACHSQKHAVKTTHDTQSVCFYRFSDDTMKVFLSDRFLSAYSKSVNGGQVAAATDHTTKKRAAVTAPLFSLPDITITRKERDSTLLISSKDSVKEASEPPNTRYSITLFILPIAVIAVTAIVCFCLRRK